MILDQLNNLYTLNSLIKEIFRMKRTTNKSTQYAAKLLNSYVYVIKIE